MINKLYAERALMYAPDMAIFFSVKISGCPSIDDMKVAIDYAVNRFEILRCRVLQDSEGEAYYVLRENRCVPNVEIRNYHMNMSEFVEEQKKIPFRFTEGEFVRFIVEVKDGNVMYLRIASHHMGGDGNSICILINEIMNSLQKIYEGTFLYEDTDMIPLVLYNRKTLERQVNVHELVRCTMEEFNRKWNCEKVIFTYDDYLKMYNKFWLNYKSEFKSFKIHKEMLTVIKQLSRENNVSINSMLVTAAAKGMVKSKKMSIVVDTRPSDYDGMGNFAGSLLIESIYDNKKSFWENAQYIHNQIHSQLADRVKTMFGVVFKGLLEDTFQDALSFRTGGCFTSDLVKEYDEMYGFEKNRFPVVVSNLGTNRLKDDYGRFKIEEAQFVSPKTPGIDCNIAVITTNNILTLTMQYYNKADIDYGKVFEVIVSELEELVMEKEDEEYLELA